MSASPEFPKLPTYWMEETDLINKEKLFTRLYYKKSVLQAGRPIRFLFIVHGLGEQSDRYQHFPFYLQSTVDAIGILDLPGHGCSSGVRGHIESYDHFSEACLMALQHFKDRLKKSVSEIEVHWFGHSMGGLITLRTLLKKKDLQISSVTVSAPLLAVAFQPPKIKTGFAFLIEPLLGRLPFKNEVNSNDLSHDASVCQEYEKNPLNHDKVTPRWYVRTLREMDLLKTPHETFSYPLMLLAPLGDRMVSWKAGFQFMERVKMKAGCKKEIQSFPEFFHESFNELEKARAFLALETWIQKNTRLI